MIFFMRYLTICTEALPYQHQKVHAFFTRLKKELSTCLTGNTRAGKRAAS